MPRIAVCGSDSALSREVEEIAAKVGRGIAERGGILISGGRGGVMEAASRGAKQVKGLTVAILPGRDDSDANPFIDIPIPTSMDRIRNFLVVRAADAVIGVAGKWGTLSEISMALNLSIPVVVIRGTGGVADWLASNHMEFDKMSYTVVDDPEEAVRKAFELAER